MLSQQRRGAAIFAHSLTVQILEEVYSWKELTSYVADQLIKNEKGRSKYIDEIDESLEQFGPYYLLPNVILFHGRPGKEYSNALVIVKLNKAFTAVEDNLPVKLIIGMTTEDSNAHLKLLKYLVEKLKVHQNVVSILSTEKKEEIEKIIHGF
ncbi:PTS sugar transporter subunit IIA [Vagococcus elongatus]